MPLPTDVMRLFANPAATKVIATVDAGGTVHAAPFGSLTATSDGSRLIFCQSGAEETAKRLTYMKHAGKMAVAVVQLTDVEKRSREGYSVCCNVGDALTSGPIYDIAAERIMKVGVPKPKAVWILNPVSYKVHTPGPDREKIVTL